LINATATQPHIIPEEEYLVNNAPTLNNQETLPENGTELMVETPESHLLLQSSPGFDQLKHFTTNIEQRDSNIACFRDESLAKHGQLPEIIQDQNPSATNSATNTPENSRKPTFTNMPENGTKRPENGTKLTLETTGPHLIKPFNNLKMVSPKTTLNKKSPKPLKRLEIVSPKTTLNKKSPNWTTRLTNWCSSDIPNGWQNQGFSLHT
jgi:hypothetical protein